MHQSLKFTHFLEHPHASSEYPLSSVSLSVSMFSPIGPSSMSFSDTSSIPELLIFVNSANLCKSREYQMKEFITYY